MCGLKKGSAEFESTPAARVVAVVPMDDRKITGQYHQLYETVHTWSDLFLTHPPPRIPKLIEAEDQLVRAVVLLDNLDPILENKFLRRSLMEGLVGRQISLMLDVNSMSLVYLEPHQFRASYPKFGFGYR